MSILPRFPEPYTLPGSASNEWAVDGHHTATGAPLLAGDPHLAFGFPGDLVSGPDRDAGRRAGRRHRAGRPGHGPRPQQPHRLDLHHHRRRRAGRVHRDAGGRGPLPDTGRPASIHRPRGAHQDPRRARPDADGPGNPARPGDQRPARGWRSHPRRRHGQSGARQHRRRRACSRSTRRGTWRPPGRLPP